MLTWEDYKPRLSRIAGLACHLPYSFIEFIREIAAWLRVFCRRRAHHLSSYPLQCLIQGHSHGLLLYSCSLICLLLYLYSPQISLFGSAEFFQKTLVYLLSPDPIVLSQNLHVRPAHHSILLPLTTTSIEIERERERAERQQRETEWL
jgi:hypothetical protein